MIMKKELLFIMSFALIGMAFGIGVYFNSKDEGGALTMLAYDLLVSVLMFSFFEGIATVCTDRKKFALIDIVAGVVASLTTVGVCLIV